MFYTVISRETFNAIMTLFFKNLGLIDKDIELQIDELSFDGDDVIVEADIKQETLQ